MTPTIDLSAYPRILVVRSGPTALMLRFLDDLQRAHPTCEIGVLTHQAFEAQCRSLPFVGHVEVYQGGRFFSAWGLRGAVARQIRARRYHAAVLLFGNTDGRGYDNVVRMAKVTRVNPILAFDLEGRLGPAMTPRSRWLQRVADASWIASVGLMFVSSWLLLPIARVRFTQRARRITHVLASEPSVHAVCAIEKASR